MTFEYSINVYIYRSIFDSSRHRIRSICAIPIPIRILILNLNLIHIPLSSLFLYFSSFCFFARVVYKQLCAYWRHRLLNSYEVCHVCRLQKNVSSSTILRLLLLPRSLSWLKIFQRSQLELSAPGFLLSLLKAAVVSLGKRLEPLFVLIISIDTWHWFNGEHWLF